MEHRQALLQQEQLIPSLNSRLPLIYFWAGCTTQTLEVALQLMRFNTTKDLWEAKQDLFEI